MKATFLEPLPGWAFSIPKSLCCLLRLPGAGGLSLYEIATLDVGLVSAGWCRTLATLLKNPAGMSLLDGNQFQGGLQVLQAGPGFTPGATTTVDGNSVGNAVVFRICSGSPVGHADQWIKPSPAKDGSHTSASTDLNRRHLREAGSRGILKRSSEPN